MSDPEGGAHSGGGEPGGGEAYRRLVDGLSSHAIFELDVDGTISTWSEPARTLYGFDADAVRGESLRVLFAADAELDRPLEAVLQEARDGTVRTDHWHRRADGSVFWGSLTLEPLRGDDGTVVGFAAVCQDTTDRKQYEQMLERQNDRLKEFTDILAHDLRTPLNVIDGRLDLYDQTDDHEHIEAIGETTDRMERLVDDLLRVARQGDVVTDPEPTDIGDVVDTAWAGIEASGSGASLAYDPVGLVSADADRLRELFENLFGNAVEHGTRDSQSAVDADGQADAGVTVSVGPLAGGFFVEDDGPGIAESVRGKAFDHGVSSSDDGSGYGLSIVRTIANAHGWDVVVRNADAGGARFEITGIEPVE